MKWFNSFELGFKNYESNLIYSLINYYILFALYLL